jgi:hypothetical protein
MKRRFIITLETDGMDYPSDMQEIERALQSALPSIVRPFVRETAPATVTWQPRSAGECQHS